MHIAITGIGLTSGLGDGADRHVAKISAGQHALRSLSGLLVDGFEKTELNAAWIENREVMLSEKWAPASMLSLHVAKQAIADAGLSAADVKDAAVVVGSSHGNVAGWSSRSQACRPFTLMASSHAMHGELASAVSTELGITGPWQLITGGCAASLDAMGMAWMMLRQGMIKRAIVIGVELPLIPEVLHAYERTGELATSNGNDPYSSDTTGFFPGEAGAAVVLESMDAICARRQALEAAYPGGHLTSRLSMEEQAKSMIQMTGYWCNSGADSAMGASAGEAGLRDCLSQAVEHLTHEPEIVAVCPHASGDLVQANTELAALRAVLPDDRTISLHPLKPFTGHTAGASGLLDVAILARYLSDRKLPPSLPGHTTPGAPFTREPNRLSAGGSSLLKIAVGRGGHNSIVALKSPVTL